MTKEEKMREIFYRFLKKRKAYSKFMKNLKNKKIAWENSIDHMEENKYLTDTFPWGGSPEKYEYWERLNNEWREILQQLKFKPTKELEEYHKFLGGEN